MKTYNLRYIALCSIFVAPSALITSAQAQNLTDSDITTATQLRQQAMTGNNVAYELVESLTTEVGARPGGSPADALAVAWAGEKLKSMGFDRVWTEPVSFPYWNRKAESARLIAPNDQHLAITALGGSPRTPSGGVQAQVVHFTNLEALQAAEDNSLDGKIAFISNRMERARDGSGYGVAVQARSNGPEVAANKGAAALLIRSIGTDNDRLPHAGNTRQPQAGSAIVPAAALSNPDADQLVRLLERGITPIVHLDLDVGFEGTAISHNVFAEVTGQQNPDDFLLLAAHLDSWDMGTGAIDDGAGVAIITAAAKLILDLEQKPKRSIRIGLFANEEQGLFGGFSFLEKLKQDNENNPLQHLIMAVESDFGAGRIYRIDARVNDPGWQLVEKIHPLLEPIGITLGENNKPGGSDIFPLINAGAANIALRQDGTTYFDYHHTDNDTLDKIEPGALNQNVAAYAVLSWLIAQDQINLGSGTLN